MNEVACLKESLQFCMHMVADYVCAPSPLEMECKICVYLKPPSLNFTPKVVFCLVFSMRWQYLYSDMNGLNDL